MLVLSTLSMLGRVRWGQDETLRRAQRATIIRTLNHPLPASFVGSQRLSDVETPNAPCFLLLSLRRETRDFRHQTRSSKSAKLQTVPT